MADRIRRVAGDLFSGLTWANCGFTLTDFNSLANGSVVVATSDFDNGTHGDLWADISFKLTVGGTTVASGIVAAYVLPLNQDGTTYGDGAASGATLPSYGYHRGQIGVKPGVLTNNPVTGTIEGVRLPVGRGKIALANLLTIPLHATAAAEVKARIYDLTTNG